MKRIVLFLCSMVAYSLSYAGVPIDFSRVGYRWGEKALPDYPTRIVLTPPEDGSDATALIQEALDNVPAPGAVLLKEGRYSVSGRLLMDRDSVVLRGEGDGTVIFAEGTEKRILLCVGKTSKREVGKGSLITDKFTPVGQMWVKVEDGSRFAQGDRVVICLRPNEKWIRDLKMDIIAQNKAGSVKQWAASQYVLRWERLVTKVSGDKVWFDNPVVMELDYNYMEKATLEHVKWDRVQECGVENIRFESDKDLRVIEKKSSGVFKGLEYCCDEQHAWSAIEIKSAEHCWVRNVTAVYFGYSLVEIKQGAKNITIRDCVFKEPVSLITGARRYAFNISGGELCLVEKCRAEHDRHGFVTGARVPGPNVFTDCDMVNAYGDIGPHHRWSTGVLYDCCRTDGLLAVQDRAGYGTGHGWAGVSFVFWNCVAKEIICQNPWISGQNWCIGCTGEKLPGRRYKDDLVRPDGEWVSHGKQVEPKSLYRSQLASRKFKITSVIK